MGPIGPLGPLAAGPAAHVAACGAGAHVGAAVAMGGRAAQQWVARRTLDYLRRKGSQTSMLM